MATPPMVGVPALVMWPWGPSSLMGWPIPWTWSQRMRAGVPTTDTTSETAPATRSEITWSPGGLGQGRARGRGQDLLEPLGGMGVVDDDGEGLTQINRLEPARDRAHPGQPPGHRLRGHTQRAGRGGGGQGVAHVEEAAHAQCY